MALSITECNQIWLGVDIFMNSGMLYLCPLADGALSVSRDTLYGII